MTGLLEKCRSARRQFSIRAARPPVPAALAMALAALLATACAPSAPVPAAPAAGEPTDLTAVVPVSDSRPDPQLPVTVRSDDGRDVAVTDVTRVVAVNLSGTLAEIVFSLGLGDNVVGRDVATTFDAAADLPVVTVAHDLSAEGVLALDPTLVLADRSIGPPEALQQLRAAGIPVVLVPEAWSLEEVYPRITAVAEALGVPDAGRALVERTREQVEQALAAAPRRDRPLRIAFLYVRGNAGVYLMGGRGSGADSLFEAIGAVDAGSAIGLERFRPLTSEGLVLAAPDVIVVMSKGLESVGGPEGLLEVAGVAQTPAGQGRRFVAMDDGALLSFGPRTGAVVTELARQVEAVTTS
ncbi:MAG TPA: ABC transporter substrate-binding protein [Mycobacteriales bacterium]|nr:ABC transporter substrate-binding protein [Mycobacteriales bacterium]